MVYTVNSERKEVNVGNFTNKAKACAHAKQCAINNGGIVSRIKNTSYMTANDSFFHVNEVAK
jgi:hypothetical protein